MAAPTYARVVPRRRCSISREENERMRGLVEAAWRTYHQPLRGVRVAKPLIRDGNSPDVVKRWLRRERPDVFLCGSDLHDVYEQLGLAAHGVGFFTLTRTPTNDWAAGINPRCDLLAATAVELVVQCLEAGETGIPPSPRSVLIEGAWSWERTLRAPAA